MTSLNHINQQISDVDAVFQARHDDLIRHFCREVMRFIGEIAVVLRQMQGVGDFRPVAQPRERQNMVVLDGIVVGDMGGFQALAEVLQGFALILMADGGVFNIPAAADVVIRQAVHEVAELLRRHAVAALRRNVLLPQVLHRDAYAVLPGQLNARFQVLDGLALAVVDGSDAVEISRGVDDEPLDAEDASALDAAAG